MSERACEFQHRSDTEKRSLSNNDLLWFQHGLLFISSFTDLAPEISLCFAQHLTLSCFSQANKMKKMIMGRGLTSEKEERTSWACCCVHTINLKKREGKHVFPLPAFVSRLKRCSPQHASSKPLQDFLCVWMCVYGAGVLPDYAFAYKRAIRIHGQEKQKSKGREGIAKICWIWKCLKASEYICFFRKTTLRRGLFVLLGF